MKRFFPIWIIPVLVVLSVGTVWLRLSMVRTTYEIHKVNEEIGRSQQENERLRLEVAQLKSPRTLARLAKRKFQLAPPGAHQVLHIRKLPKLPERPGGDP